MTDRSGDGGDPLRATREEVSAQGSTCARARHRTGEWQAGRRRLRLGRGALAPLLVSLAALLMPATASAAPALLLTTAYPAVAVAAGSKVTFDLSVKPPRAEVVSLQVGGIPTGWTASLHGGGYVIDGVYADPASPPSVRLDVTVPVDAGEGAFRVPVTASAGTDSSTLTLEIRVAPSAGGRVSLATDFPALQGPSAATYRFNLTLSNDTPQDLTFALTAAGPDGWDIQVRPTSQSQASSAVVQAGSSTGIELTAAAPASATAGQYPIDVRAVAGDKVAESQVGVEITGSYSMNLTTPDQRLNAQGVAGQAIDQQLEIDNTGTASLASVKLTATPPSGWTVAFEPDTVDQIAPGDIAQVTAHITPAGSALAGDYVVTFRAASQEANASREFRVTVETSIAWAIVGVAIIVLTLVGLGWVFQRYGRR